MLQTQCVYCEAGTEFLNIIQMNFMLPRLKSIILIGLFKFQEYLSYFLMVDLILTGLAGQTPSLHT
jgi:hypothetical protein